ncbi:MAG: hypothetical protein HXY40_15375 [Chloroflexi bacterium]|nr:hypothetical protein [Chloroflexota bacterium]
MSTSTFPQSITRILVAWLVIALLTIGIMKVNAITSTYSDLPLFYSAPALNWSGHNAF